MLLFYRYLTLVLGPLLSGLLFWRQINGKEDPERIDERKGIASSPRPSKPPSNKLIWIHAASVGEAQSALILIDALLAKHNTVHFLVTTGTRTSAALMTEKLPAHCTHQFYPLDHPRWVDRFLNHWRPDLIFWMESELWPNMLSAIQSRNIPAALINARLSERSFKNWKRFPSAAKKILSTFETILAQTQTEADYFRALGADQVVVTDNLKYSASPLPHNEDDLKALKTDRPVWLYASSHAGEEELATHAHLTLKEHFPDLLTIIVPRHPERAEGILDSLKNFDLTITRRGHSTELSPRKRGSQKNDKKIPGQAEEYSLFEKETDIYLADTLGELGLFYRLAPLCVVGRCFSDDGGGGHNPIEPALLGCATLHGPHIQNLSAIYDEMDDHGVAHLVQTPDQLAPTIQHYLSNKADLNNLQKAGQDFARSKANVLDRVLKALDPVLKPLDET